jgi:Heterokaryon incompatibility protein (HET)
MKDIYEKAKAVTVWLGTQADNSGLALKTIRAMHLIADVRAKARLYQAMPFFLQSFPFMTPYPQLLGIGEDETKLLCSALLVAAPAYASPNIEFAKMAAEALRKLFDRPWWQRVWIIQEVTVPHKDIFVMCGKDSVTWESCQEASDLYANYAFSNLTLALPFFNIDKLLRIQRARRDATGPTRKQSLSLATLCKNYMHFGATDNRDRVYALLGLAEDIDLATYTVDYEQPTLSTYLYMTRYLIEKHQNLDIFGFCCHPSWISWCPHWVWRYIPIDPFHRLNFKGGIVDAVHKTRDGRSLYTYQPLFNAHDGSKIPPDRFGIRRWGRIEDFQPTPAYCASKGAKPTFRFHRDSYDGFDPPKIILQGFTVDVVTGQPLPATPPATPTTEVERTVWEPAVLASSDTYVTGELVLTAFRRTIRADVATQNDGMPRRGASVIWSLNEIQDDEDDEDGDYNFSLAEYYLQHSLHNCRVATRGRSLFRTEKGYMGLAPDEVREGDLICVLFGGQLAYCLRRTDDKEETYHLIGESYLHGIMDGEAMEDLAGGKYEEREFILK